MGTPTDPASGSANGFRDYPKRNGKEAIAYISCSDPEPEPGNHRFEHKSLYLIKTESNDTIE